jgi:multidrug efflux system membrane fusion protein
VPAVQQGPRGAYVYVVDKAGVAQMRPVKVGQINDGQALIDDGLRANETVIVAGQYRVEPGSHVRFLTGEAARQANLTSAVEQALP